MVIIKITILNNNKDNNNGLVISVINVQHVWWSSRGRGRPEVIKIWHWLPRCPKSPIQLPLVISDPSLLHPFYHALLRKSLLRDGSTQPSHSAPSKINLPFAPLEVPHALLYSYSIILVVCWNQ